MICHQHCFTNVGIAIINHPPNHHFYGWDSNHQKMGGLWHCYTHIKLDCKLNSTHLGRSKDPPPQPNEPSGITIAIGDLTSSSCPGGDFVDIAHSSLLELFTHLGCGKHDGQRQHASGKRTLKYRSLLQLLSFPFHLS